MQSSMTRVIDTRGEASILDSSKYSAGLERRTDTLRRFFSRFILSHCLTIYLELQHLSFCVLQNNVKWLSINHLQVHKNSIFYS